MYNKIIEVIGPHEQAAPIHYYNIVPLVYKNKIDYKVVDSIDTTLQTWLKYEDHIKRIGLPMAEINKSPNMIMVL